MSEIAHEQKLEFIQKWCNKHKLIMQLEGSCGFGRECVGVIDGDQYPEYSDWETYGTDVWVPDDAYHKHACVAVLGRGENAENQLYQWVKWFDQNGYKIIREDRKPSCQIDALINGFHTSKIVKE